MTTAVTRGPALRRALCLGSDALWSLCWNSEWCHLCLCGLQVKLGGTEEQVLGDWSLGSPVILPPMASYSARKENVLYFSTLNSTLFCFLSKGPVSSFGTRPSREGGVHLVCFPRCCPSILRSQFRLSATTWAPFSSVYQNVPPAKEGKQVSEFVFQSLLQRGQSGF